MLQTFNPPVAPSVGGTVKPKVKVLKSEFGDGYTQRTRDGLNHIRQTVELVWSVLTRDEANQIIGFLHEHGGTTPFLWSYFGDTERKWTCDDWSTTPISGGYWSVTAKLEQDFSLQS
ncbi:phage tail protein [Mongoliimonas terrestris]|uniref:phage tail protein n=1 Tax=Mongoliimonas terrestris TaxID=1709001 RepID=UPI00094961D8|nr:phage tail protein [Mongoliimonas terrestris]